MEILLQKIKLTVTEKNEFEGGHNQKKISTIWKLRTTNTLNQAPKWLVRQWITTLKCESVRLKP